MTPFARVSLIPVAALLIAASASVGAQPNQAPPRPGPPKDWSLPSPKRITLANGLPVTMVQWGQIPKVTLRLVVEAANVHESKADIWLANLTGQMLTEGTSTLSADALAREFAGMGGQLGVRIGPDTASVSTDVLSAHGPKALQLIADVTQRPRLPESELARVKANMLRDLAIRKSTPQAAAQEKFAELLYADHRYGRLFPTEQMLKGYTIEQVRSFHRDHYGAKRARLYVAGVFDPAEMEVAIRKAFEGWSARTPHATKQPEPAAGTGRFALIDRTGAPQSTVMLGLTVPDPSHADWVPLEVTDALLGGAFGSRITANIREQKGYTYSPFSTLDTHPKLASWVETADVTTKDTGASLKEIFFEIERLHKEAAGAEELEGIKNFLAGVFVVQNASRGGVIGRLVFADEHGLGDQYLASYVKRVMAVTPQDVQRVARQYLVPERMTVVVVGDTNTVKAQVAPWSKAP